ncbi:cytochrome c maturation protein CcmE, partial [Achromobacter aegrifaciens]|uniref:cytochrome c maturation protein CcmE n=1 Tax=Achromobacter aegrifaciens TaxID=1287736 RepID=UPI0028AB4392
MSPRKRRALAILGGLGLLAAAAALVLNALQSNLVFFFSPTQVVAKEAPASGSFRVGGLVEQGSLRREADGLTLRFVVTDTAHTVPVTYQGLLPDLFREGKGVVVAGKLGPDGVFRATEVLAKHDENYMPPEAADALKRAGAQRHARGGAMIPEIGLFSLILALLVALAQGVLPLVGAATGWQAGLRVARPAAIGQFGLTTVAIGCLAWAFVDNDFSVLYVAANSHADLPAAYRFAAVWGGHEGSLLLWLYLLTAWTLAVALCSRRLPLPFVGRVLAVMGWISVGFLLFLLFLSNPFERLMPPAMAGRDLNPLLQDPGMIVHPPMLYMGYVGFSVAFAFAIAALLSGELDAMWARWVRPWTLAAWTFLTIGILLGSAWAYYVLGWGGWWFWDPVENASFMPWLAGTALIHSLIVTERRGAFRSWTVLLAICTFSLSILGTFLVRSGVLTSVHAFAVDPGRGLYILGFMLVIVGGSLALYAWRAPTVGLGGGFSPLSRESLLLSNNVVLTVAAGSVLLGTLYPVVLDVLEWGKISIGPPYFEAVFVPLMTPAIFLMGVGPVARWKQAELPDLGRRLRVAFAVSVATAVLLPLAMPCPARL